VIEDDSVAYRQIFVDIADNALGITSSVRTRFDHRKIVNRCVEPVLKHALLAERVDLEQDRIGGTSPSLLGAKHIADLIRTVQVGIDGRIGKRLEDELREDALVERTNRFLDVLIEGFAPLGQVADGELSPEQLRKSSLLGSSSMLRVLAGAYYELSSVQQWDDEQVAEYFRTLEPHMQAPLDAKSPWLAELGGEIFSEGALAPKARRQDLKALTDAIVRWALEPPPWLAAELTETSA